MGTKTGQKKVQEKKQAKTKNAIKKRKSQNAQKI